MSNPFLSRGRVKQHGQKAERKTATRLGGNVTPASGALDGAKGDFETVEFLMENKSTEADSLRLEFEWLVKIAGEAVDRGKSPALTFQFVTLDGSPKQDGAWVCLPEYLFRELLEKK